MSGPFEFEIIPLSGATASELELEAAVGEFETEFEIGELGEFEELEGGYPIGEFETESGFGEFHTGLGETEFGPGEFEAFELEAPVAWEVGKTLPECPPKPQPVDCPRPGTQPTAIIDYFDFDRSDLKTGCHGLLIDEIVSRLIQSQSSSQPIRSLLIAGHTDRVGNDDYNFELGRRRATAVLKRLCARLHEKKPGLARQIKFQLTTCGERQLRATSQLSRRVEVFLPAPPRPKGCPPFKERIRLHLKILVWPTVSIPTMLKSLRQVYEPAGFLIEVVSCEVLKLTTLEELSIGCPDPAQRCHIMPCANSNLNAEHIALFGNRNNVGANEVAVYFVRQTDPGVLGICDHPPGRPGLVVTADATQWTLAHELGHVVGLSHVLITDRLMIDSSLGGTPAITNPPPDLVAAEIATMTASDLTLSC